MTNDYNYEIGRTSYWVALNGKTMITTSNTFEGMATWRAIVDALDALEIPYTIKSSYKEGDEETHGWSFLNVEIRTR